MISTPNHPRKASEPVLQLAPVSTQRCGRHEYSSLVDVGPRQHNFKRRTLSSTIASPFRLAGVVGRRIEPAHPASNEQWDQRRGRQWRGTRECALLILVQQRLGLDITRISGRAGPTDHHRGPQGQGQDIRAEAWGADGELDKGAQVSYRATDPRRLLTSWAPRQRIDLQPATSYQRLLVHRCSAYYKLSPEGDPVTKGISVHPTPESRM